MTTKETGGPAFPAHDYVVGNIQKDGFQKLGESRGMTLRDWFAASYRPDNVQFNEAAALEKFMGRAFPEGLVEKIQFFLEAQAKAAYMHADAMLKARGE